MERLPFGEKRHESANKVSPPEIVQLTSPAMGERGGVRVPLTWGREFKYINLFIISSIECKINNNSDETGGVGSSQNLFIVVSS